MPTNLSTVIQPLITGEYGAITAPHVGRSSITINDHRTEFLSISLEASHSWPNRIFENSRYLKLAIRDGKVECISKSYKLPTFRKSKAATPEDVVRVVNRYLARVYEMEEGDS